MRPELPPDACWTSLVGGPVHSLGALPEKCLTCAAKVAEDRSRVERMVAMFAGLGAPSPPDTYAMPMPSTAEECREQGLTFAERDPSPGVG